jgi:methionyl-tRNA synthetase
MLKALGLPLPETVLAHGWWLVDQQKMSKSLGNVVRPLDLAKAYGVDGFRYYLVREMVLGQDSSFSEEAFIHRYNSDLANDLGNLVHRTVVMAHRYASGRTPPADPSSPVLAPLRNQADRTAEGIAVALPRFDTTGILESIQQLVREANRFAEAQAPWMLARDAARRSDLDATIYGLLETVRHLSIWLYPLMPGKAGEIWGQIGGQGALSQACSGRGRPVWGELSAGAAVRPGNPIFPRIESVRPRGSDPGGREGGPMPDERKALVSYDDFARLDLRVARVMRAERVEKADRLLRLVILVGDEERQIVAGVAQHYAPEDLVGRQIVVVANLEPATIRGVESRGMLLAASGGEVLALLAPDKEVAEGTRVS